MAGNTIADDPTDKVPAPPSQPQASQPPAEPAAPASPAAADPLKAVRLLKRRVQIGVYAAIFLSEPFYYFVLDFSLTQLLPGLAIGLTIAFTAIEGAFNQMFKLRKRSAYPGVLLQELGSVSGVGAAAEQALLVITNLFRLTGSFTALADADGLKLLWVSGMSHVDAEGVLAAGAQEVRQAMREQEPVPLTPPSACPLDRDERMVFVPVIALQQTVGVLALIGRKGHPDLKDRELLLSTGVALGLSLENLRQKEELRQGEERLRTIVTGAPVVLFAVDNEGVFTLVEGKGLEAMGVAPGDVVGRSAFEVYANRPEIRMEFERALAGEEVTSTAEIAGVILESRLSPIRDRNGEVAGVIGVGTDITERTRAEEALQASERRFRALIENSSDGIALISPAGEVVYAGPSTSRVIGYSPQEFLGLSVLDLTHPDDLGRGKAAMTQVLGKPGGMIKEEFRSRHKDGSWRWLEVVATNLIEEPSVGAIVVNYRDITQRKLAEQALRESEERYRAVTELVSDYAYAFRVEPDGTFVRDWVTEAFTRITGYTIEEIDALGWGHLAYKDDAPVTFRTQRALLAGESDVSEFRILTKTGELRWIRNHAHPVWGEEEQRVIGIYGAAQDITERKRAEDMVRHLAYHDALTRLPNRALFEDRLRLALAQANRSKEMLAVMFLDLDRFKLVNDTVGHGGGDKLLQDVAEQLSTIVREGDTVARVGGDEFTLLLPGISHKEDAIEIAQRILEVLKQPRQLSGQEFRVSTSIGITIYPQDGRDSEALLSNADTAMYRAKERGRDNYQLYTPAMNANVLERLSLENDLRHALERNEFLVNYQPLVNLASGRIVGAEALLRWQHPERGLIAPDGFVPFAEETGLILPLGEWVLRSACVQNRAWQDAGYAPIRVTVNLSAPQLQQDGLVRSVSQILLETGLAAEHLQLEITEGAVMKNVEFIITMLHQLREMGVGISVDDFGTGYSSLSYLKRFPIDAVKIDRSFVRDLANDPNDAAIVTTVIAMARNLNLKVIAEGVETEEQLDFLRHRGCDEFQGYLVSKPVPPEALERLLARDGRARSKIVPLKSA